ncbi:MAG TPA: heme-binding beta-barrel domain-containing protein [Acidimicrobiales bacterium]|nr:heme-binding beta-barrel domain-containing protein [Acidimicrobiales bacterium]
MSAGPEWGPLARLAGVWEGDQGEDVAYSNEKGEIGLTPYREHTEFKPFGPVENGIQSLYGLDYRMAAWRGTEENPFHTEVGYWLWDATDGQVMRCFLIPRGSALIAGGSVAPDATSFTLTSEVGSETYGILSNNFLAAQARTVRYEVEIAISDDGVFTYEEVSLIEHGKLPEHLSHTDRNTLHKIADA